MSGSPSNDAPNADAIDTRRFCGGIAGFGFAAC